MNRRTNRNPGALKARDIVERFLAFQAQACERGKLSRAYYDYLCTALGAQSGQRYVSYVDLFGDRTVDDLRQADLAEWIATNPQWVAPDTRHNNVKYVICCFNWAVEEELIQHSPYRRTHRLREERRTRRDVTDEETAKIFAAASEPLRRILWFIDQTGVRTSEARLLTWSQIRWDDRMAVLEEHKTRHSQKEPRPRFIALNDAVLRALQQWHEEREPGQTLVFLSNRRHGWTKGNLARRFEFLRRRIGLPSDLSPYCFRHRFATQGIIVGMPERAVGDLMGHTNSQMIRRYSHTARAIDHLRDRANEMAAARTARKPGEPHKTSPTVTPPASSGPGLSHRPEETKGGIQPPDQRTSPAAPCAGVFYVNFSASPAAAGDGFLSNQKELG